MTGKLKRVLIMAGGTGGHVFPGLAVASVLQARGVDVHWLGTKQGLESRVVVAAHIPLHHITISGLRGKGLLPLLLAPVRILRAMQQARHIIKAVNPDVVIGMGGFASGPGGVASWLMRRPLVIHEQNAKAGFTNKLLAYIAARVLEGYPQAFKRRRKVMCIGNPVRDDIASIMPPAQRLQTARSGFRLLVLGGSLGADAINRIVPQALAELAQDERPEVLHQTGNQHFVTAEKEYLSLGLKANLQPFITDMAHAYGWADMVLCRAGALTVAELCAVGLGAIFVPFPHAVDDHQTANADFMVRQQAAICIKQSELTAPQLAAIVRQYAGSQEKRFKMAQAAYQLRHEKVAEKIVEICEEVCP